MGRRIWQFSLCLLIAVVLLLMTTFSGEEKPTELIYQYESSTQHQLIVPQRVAYINVSSGNDIMVFIHIQKTGGSAFLGHLTTSESVSGDPVCFPPGPLLKSALKRRKEFAVCPLERRGIGDDYSELPEMWLSSERTYGWICGVHPFLSETESCLRSYLAERYGPKKRNFHFITMIRHPVLRYISEFLHVTRGATWPNRHTCNGHTMDEFIPPCYQGYYEGVPWANVTFNRFSHCSSNWANNRQTIMLANLSSVKCLDKRPGISLSSRDYFLLESAKASLEEMPFFGLSEYFVESCLLFQKQFKVIFKRPCTQKRLANLHSAPLLAGIWFNRTLYNSIVLINHLDMQLYEFALALFTTRLKYFNINIDQNKVDKDVQRIHHTQRRRRQRQSVSLF